ISLGGLALPFALGVALAPLVLAQPDLGRHPQSDGAPPTVGFTLFLGISLSITAMPVLARIMMELGITRTRLATITITAAAGEDAIGWILLASIAAVVRSEFELGRTLLMVLATTAFALAMIFLARPQARTGEIGITTLAVILSTLFLCAIATNLIGIF